jgi:zinc protease
MGVNPENLRKAVDGIRLETDRLHKEPLTDQEISDGKDNQIGSLKVSLERNAEMAGELFRMEYFGLGLDYLKRFPEMIRSLTAEQIHEAAEKYIRIEDCSLAVAGPVGRDQEKKLQLS